MSSTMDFDDATARMIDQVYASPDVAATRQAVYRSIAPREGEHFLDLGSGPGYLAIDFARSAGPTGSCTGVDLSAAMIQLAGEKAAGIDNLDLNQADITALPFDDARFDAITALQTLAYVPDLDAALGEIARVLRPGGRAVILDTDFDGIVWQARDRTRMRRILDAYDSHVAWPDLPRILPTRLKAAGLSLMRCEIAPLLNLSYHPNSFVAGMTRVVGAYVARNGIAQDEVDAWTAEQQELDQAGEFFFSMPRFLFHVTKPQT